MSVPLPLRAHVTRRLAAIAAVGLLGALSPLAVAAPAAAAPTPSPCPALFGGTAASELLALRLLDLNPLGLSLPPAADLHVSTTRSGIAGGPDHAASEAKYLQAKLLGHAVPAGVLAAGAYQQAPPPHATPTVVPTVGVNLPVLQVGTGGLAAHATVGREERCAPGSGPASETSAKLGRTRVLPGRRGTALLGADALATHTSAAVIGDGGRPAAEAVASGDLTRIQLFAGTPRAISVKVLSQPKLRVVAGAKKSVDYEAPIFEVTLPGRAPQRLSAAGDRVEIALPVDAASSSLAGDLGREEKLPVLSGLSLGSLLGTVPGVPTENASAPASPAGSVLGDLPGVPGLAGLADDLAGGLLSGDRTASEHTTLPQGKAGQVVVLQLSVGELSKEVTATGVHAKAASLRVRVLTRSKWAGHKDADGHGIADNTALVDFGLCVLEAAAAAPKQLPSYGSHNGAHHGAHHGDHHGGDGYGSGSGNGDTGGNGGVSGGNGPTPVAHATGNLPVTGNNIAYFLGAGVLLVLAGRFLMVMARKRTTMVARKRSMI